MKATPAESRARAQFLTFVKEKHPALYAAAIGEANRAVNAQLGDAATPAPATESWWQKALGVITTAGSTYVNLRAQKEALKLNLQRMEQNLPPVDVEKYTASAAPVVRTQVNLPPEIITRITESAGTNINKLLLVGGGLAVVALLAMRKK